MLTNLISTHPTATSATALAWQPSARKQRAAVEGVPCPNYLPSDAAVAILALGFEAKLEGGLFGGRRDNQD
jgi:hypothetical protein